MEMGGKNAVILSTLQSPCLIFVPMQDAALVNQGLKLLCLISMKIYNITITVTMQLIDTV
jgi:hypothetical protein